MVTRERTRLGDLTGIRRRWAQSYENFVAAKLKVKLTVGMCGLLPVSLLTNFGDGIATIGSRKVIY